PRLSDSWQWQQPHQRHCHPSEECELRFPGLHHWWFPPPSPHAPLLQLQYSLASGYFPALGFEEVGYSLRWPVRLKRRKSLCSNTPTKYKERAWILFVSCAFSAPLDLLYVSTQLLWWYAVTGAMMVESGQLVAH